MSREGNTAGRRKYFIVPLIVSVSIIAAFAFFIYNTDTDNILNYKPDNIVLAAFVFLGFYGLKSISVIVPLAALYVSVGAIYPYYIAVPLNIVGLVIAFTIPYLIGRASGSELMEHIEEKYPKVRKLVSYGHDNNLFASYMSRALVVLPGDVVSLVHGALRMPYRPYLLGSLLGVMPEMLVQTYVGGSLKDLSLRSVIVMLLLIAATMLFSFLINKRVSKAGKQADIEDF